MVFWRPPTVTQGGSVGLRHHLISDPGLVRRNLVSKVSSGAEAAAQAPKKTEITPQTEAIAGARAGDGISTLPFITGSSCGDVPGSSG